MCRGVIFLAPKVLDMGPIPVEWLPGSEQYLFLTVLVVKSLILVLIPILLVICLLRGAYHGRKADGGDDSHSVAKPSR